MDIKKTTLPQKSDKQPAKPAFEVILAKKFKTWTKIEDEDIDEALKDLCGDTFFEMRKLTAQVCRAVESQELDKKIAEKLISEIKPIIDDTWRCIIDKQKVGVDKLGIIVRKYVTKD